MKDKTKSLKFIVLFIVIAAVFVFLLRYLGIGTLRSATRIGYVGNDGWSSWSASYTLLNGWQQHTIRPKTDTLHVEVKTESGTISIEMKDADGNILFSGNNIETSSFEVKASGKVVIKIEADHHKGSFDISSHSSAVVQSGQIFLYGEEHAVETILEKEFLNLWMRSETDDILEQLYQDWEGTAMR